MLWIIFRKNRRVPGLFIKPIEHGFWVTQGLMDIFNLVSCKKSVEKSESYDSKENYSNNILVALFLK